MTSCKIVVSQVLKHWRYNSLALSRWFFVLLIITYYFHGSCDVYLIVKYVNVIIILMGKCKKYVTPLLTHWSCIFLALSHRYEMWRLNVWECGMLMLNNFVEQVIFLEIVLTGQLSSQVCPRDLSIWGKIMIAMCKLWCFVWTLMSAKCH